MLRTLSDFLAAVTDCDDAELERLANLCHVDGLSQSQTEFNVLVTLSSLAADELTRRKSITIVDQLAHSLQR